MIKITVENVATVSKNAHREQAMAANGTGDQFVWIICINHICQVYIMRFELVRYDICTLEVYFDMPLGGMSQYTSSLIQKGQ